MEVIVADDGSSDETERIVAEAAAKDRRISYIRHPDGVGMRDNFELALSRVKPGFVFALGGDDGLMPGGIAGMNEMLESSGLELLAWSAPTYSYPGIRGTSGQLKLPFRGRDREILSRNFLRRQTEHLHYTGDSESPMIYVKGVASTKLVDRVRARSTDGRFYRCQTPDGYSGIVLAGEVERFAFSSKPFALFGVSPASQGLAYLRNSEKAKKASEDFFKTVSDLPMHPNLASQPYSPLITLMTAEYLLRAQELPGWPGIVPKLDYRRLLSKGLIELSHGLYGEERIHRELRILDRIATHHGLSHDFERLIASTRRSKPRSPFDGSGLNPSALFFDSEEYGIPDILEAAWFAKDAHALVSGAWPSRTLAALRRSLGYAAKMSARGPRFPRRAEWGEG